MGYRAGDAYYVEFTTANPVTGAAQTADSLPVATANHNGVDDGSFTLTVALVDTGRYKVSGAVPGGYSGGDVVNVTVAATVNAIAGKAAVDRFVLDRLPLTAAQIVTAIWTDLFSSSDFSTASSVGALLKASTAQTGDSFARLGAPAGASIAADLAEIEGETDAIVAGVTVTANNDKTGYALATAPPTATAIATSLWTDLFSSSDFSTASSVGALLKASTAQTGDSFARLGAGVTVTTNNDKTGYTVSTVQDKTGYALSSAGLDSVSTAAPAGSAGNFREMVVQTWRRFFKKSTKVVSGLAIKTYADDGATVITTQSYTDDGAGNETLGSS